ncbi:hypothetical protein H6F87_25950 [Cyanobacteria bacterium FACHB-502]|uniref:hypothetical protein n=1 Tax=Leptolyngbya sp. GB1-A1 TaxID=2933908 RepID=UPI0019CF3F36|nr:hypothetical protein [Cyanobacteria bacterium FACHB-502]
MLQQSLFTSSASQAAETVAALPIDYEAIGFNTQASQAQSSNKRSPRKPCQDPKSAVPDSDAQAGKSSRTIAEISADAKTPVLDRFAPDEVVPLTNLLTTYKAVDRRLAALLRQITTTAEVACAFTSEPHACYGEAVRLIDEAALLMKVAQNLRSLDPPTALYQFAQLPSFFQGKIWAQFTPQEQQQFAQVSKRLAGGNV